MVQTEDQKDPSEETQQKDYNNPAFRVLDFIGKFITIIIYLTFVYLHLIGFYYAGRISSLLLVILESLFAFFTFFREPPKEVNFNLYSFLVANTCFLSPLLLRPTDNPQSEIGYIFQLIGLVLGVISICALNRSVSILPSRRSIKTNSTYKLVRHPLYLSYVIGYIGYLSSNGTSYNISLLLLWSISLVLRILEEEKVLQKDSTYVEYMNKIKWRIIPLIF